MQIGNVCLFFFKQDYLKSNEKTTTRSVSWTKDQSFKFGE